ncbi:hypothetical protein OG402_16240 [Streptomyces anulatus]|uniref:hypothetical protein n=1 Tax=Streptomyces TaxID=1883 RepID=UPI00224CD77D|nr:hypothetical protein [Streptomyces anulatus]MCX4519149.1 hypothetical protein [Streptomyces anulatus]MCX4602030.1 hypothetical protein [Streptomyces anulatus]WSU74402.1 hypothetical protein OG499_16240 [Streptomyces anulatus]
MDAIQQHMLDTYRAARLAEPAPPPPGRHDRSVLRDLYRHWLTHPPTRRSGGPGRSGKPGGSGTPSPSGV